VKDNQLVDKQGTVFAFEILLEDAQFERLALPFAQNLKRLGIDARVRTIDPSQYQHRLENFDFDMTVATFPETLSPANELRDYFGSASADTVGGLNLIGIKDKAVDALIEEVINAPDQAALLTRAHALDRLLQWGFYAIPQWYRPDNRVAYWNMFGHPEKTPPYLTSTLDINFSGWWYDAAKEAGLTLRARSP
jgi:microcin C transport system substrate-binding protein